MKPHLTWSLRSRSVHVDWQNGLGTWTKLEWRTIPQQTARGVRYGIELCRAAGAELPADVMDQILVEIQQAHLPLTERSAS